MRFKAPFTLYKRSTQEGKVWCVSYYDDQGRRVRKSTGETSKPQAMKAALRMVTRQLPPGENPSSRTLPSLQRP